MGLGLGCGLGFGFGLGMGFGFGLGMGFGRTSGIAAVVDEFIVCSTYSDRTSIFSKDFSKFSITLRSGAGSG